MRIAVWLGMSVAVLLWAGCTKKQTTKGSAGVRCRLGDNTRAQLRAASARVEVSERERTAWAKLLLNQCTGWPKSMSFYLKLMLGASPEDRRSMVSPTKADEQALDRVMNHVCPGLAKRFYAAAERGPRGPSPRLWEHCGLGTLGVMTKREYGGNWLDNLHAFLVYRLLRDGGLAHRETKTLARLLMTRGRWMRQKEGEMMLVRSPARTEFVRAVQVDVSASVILVDNSPVANVKNGRVDANTKRDGPDGYFIDPLYKKLRERVQIDRVAAKSAGHPFANHPLVLVHKGTPFRLLAEVFYTARQAGFDQFQLGVHSNVATDTVTLLGSVLSPAPPRKRAYPPFSPTLMPSRSRSSRPATLPTGLSRPSTSPTPATTSAPAQFRIRMTPLVYELQSGTGQVLASFPARHRQAAQARVALAKALYARAVKLKSSRLGRGVIHLLVGDTLRYSDVIHLLHAIGQKPGPAGAGGCRLLFDARRGAWSVEPAFKTRCLFPFPKLLLPPAG